MKKIEKIMVLCEDFFKELSLVTCCFTGHRSQKLPWGFNEKDERCIDMRKRAKVEIEKAIQMGYRIFITGMALGFDMICAELVLELKKQYPEIQLIGALPCKGQEKLWKADSQKRYHKLLKKLDKAVYISEEYTKECMLQRNDYMINNSSMVIALFNGMSGGTKSTLLKAEKKGLKVVVIKP